MWAQIADFSDLTYWLEPGNIAPNEARTLIDLILRQSRVPGLKFEYVMTDRDDRTCIPSVSAIYPGSPNVD
jgi:hypothetical protein